MALVILNQPIPHSDTPLFPALWQRATYKLCVDGGGNQLYSFGKRTGTLDKYIPDVVVGDLDSLEAGPRAFYSSKGSVIQHYSDQDSTDFMKSLKYLDTGLRAGQDPKKCVVVVFGGINGRLDHTLHALKVLVNEHTNRDILVISTENLTFVLPEGKSKIEVNKEVDGPTCGILPLAGEAVLTTSGLRWNLDHFPSTFEGLMSTSNIIDDPEVYIETSRPVVWTSEFRPM
ncbi:Thiamin pyrophosphokinase [Linderina pennispora]|uniref:Thiamine pyrophosphokinase n=1 Tax=Linderina pennispora TaxID=61395 RepID=A0A1Y1W9U3_9FUNG|nr:thiamine pyrophosphokinase [Linderina pennispora]ORX70222.1 Thiamin pyrophosphokinase [Linderina pennispora]